MLRYFGNNITFVGRSADFDCLLW